jgi:hypothetical protein
MFLILTEDLELYKTSTLSEALKEECDEGILDIIRVTDGIPLQYAEGEFHEIQEIAEILNPLSSEAEKES